MLAAPPAVRGAIAAGESRDAVAMDWEALRDETDADATTTFTDATDKGDKQYVYRVWAYNARGLSRTPLPEDWAFTGQGRNLAGGPGGDSLADRQQGVGTTANTLAASAPAVYAPATGRPTVSGTPRVGGTLRADTWANAGPEGLAGVSWRYQWLAGGGEIDGATGASLRLTYSQQGQTVQVRVTLTDALGKTETRTSAATAAVSASAPAEGQLPGRSPLPRRGLFLQPGTGPQPGGRIGRRAGGGSRLRRRHGHQGQGQGHGGRSNRRPGRPGSGGRY